MTRNRVITFAAVLAAAGVGLTLLMAAGGPGERHESPPPGKPAQQLVCLGYVDAPDRITTIFPENFPQPSRVTNVLVREGDKVVKDQELLHFDNKLLDLKVREAENAIKMAQAEQAKAAATVRLHATQVRALEKKWLAKKAALDNKQSEFKEVKRLFDIVKSRNQSDLDAAEAAVAEAELNLEAARIEWEGLRADSPTYAEDLARATIKRLENLKAQAELARDQVACKAPADGRIIRSFVSDGAMFGPQTREPAFWFVKDGDLIVRAEVTQEFANRVREGQSARTEDEADGKQVWTGKVRKVGQQFLPKRAGNGSPFDFLPVSDDRVLECEVTIDGPKEAGPRFGQRVRVTLD